MEGGINISRGGVPNTDHPHVCLTNCLSLIEPQLNPSLGLVQLCIFLIN